MSVTMNRDAYARLIAEDIAWLEHQPRTLERDHVLQIVRTSVDMHYPIVPGEPGAAPLTAEEIAAIETRASGLIPDPNNFWSAYYEQDVPRLLATVQAQAEQIATYKALAEEANVLAARNIGAAERCLEREGRAHAWAAKLEEELTEIRAAVTPLADERTVDAVRRSMDEQAGFIAKLKMIAGMDAAWPTASVLERLADAADHLLRDHDCDTHGWEEIQSAAKSARAILAAIYAHSPQRGE